MQTPFSNYGILSGQMFMYGAGRAAFESPLPGKDEQLPISTKKCILIGGLSDGLLPTPYTQDLEAACQESSWSLVQSIFSSSYTGFGHSSLKRDCEEIEELMRFLIQYRNAEEFCLVGHSTGCQDAVYFLEHAAPDLISRMKVVALQAPVSDREGASSQDGYAENISKAKSLVNDGNGQEMMPRSAFWAPITAQRYLDLSEKGGADDYFSSDYTDEELAERLQHVGTSATHNNNDLKVLVAFSGADEYVPSHIDKSLLTDRLVAAMNKKCSSDKQPVAQRLYIETGNHNLKGGPEDGKLFVQKVAELLKSV
jgi:hypothetical protein